MKRCVFLSLLLGQCVISTQSAISNQTISEGSDLTIPCENEGRVDWSRRADGKREIIFRHGGSVQSKSRYSLLPNLSLVINDVWVSNSGIYFCNATAVVNLTVTPLEVMFFQRIDEGSDITIHCKNQSNVSWSKRVDRKREVILTAQHEDISQSDPDHRYSLLSNSSLVIKKTGESDSGIYYCNSTPVLSLMVTPLQRISSDGLSGSATRITGGVNGLERVIMVGLASLMYSWLQ
ncbi:uncharacterized protein Hap1MRO34_024439 [Clarias gariepinus]